MKELLGKILSFIQDHKETIFKTGVIATLGAAGAVFLGQLAAGNEDKPKSDSASDEGSVSEG